ncbi:hypothetical protein ACHWQZ_G012548 [Mnemiopsis leidyi]
MTEGFTPKDSLDHILLDYPVSNEETVSKRYNFFYDLGSGAYATVKYATCTKTNNAVAVKIISKTKTPREYLRKFVPREVDALKKLSVHGHPNIAQMREFFETPKRVYLVTKLAMGGDLLTYINSRKCLNEETSRKMIAELLCALDHIHDLGIVHRDLKCENLLIGPNDSLIVSDFGFATQQPKNRLLTTFCGSYAYAAPEILTGSSYNGKCTDVWSVGVILYAMLNGRLPFNDTKPKNILVKIKTTPLTMVRTVSVACENFVRNILTISSMERPNVGELLLKTWVEPPLRKILKTLPEKLHPACFKLALPHKSSFRMSDSSEECLKVLTPRSKDVPSPQLPLKITNEFIAENASHKTSSTISERVKQKYRHMKSELKTWASRKRKNTAVSPRFANIEQGGPRGRPTTGKLMRISKLTPKVPDSEENHPILNQMKYAVPDSKKSRKQSAHSDEVRIIRLKYAVPDANQAQSLLGTKQVDFKMMRGSKEDERSRSAVPPTTATLFERRKSGEYRAKSCNPEGKLVKTAGSTGTRLSSDSSSSNRNSSKNIKGRDVRRYSGPDSASINKQILNYLSQQRENSSYKRQVLKATNLGLPPLNQASTGTGKIGGRRKSSSSSVNSRGTEKPHSYDKAKLYHNIQSTIHHKSDSTPTHNATLITPTKMVAVHPKSRQQSYGSSFRRSSQSSQRGEIGLSTVYT